MASLQGADPKLSRTAPLRFRVAASRDQSRRLLGSTRLNQVLDVTDLCLEPIGAAPESTGPILSAEGLVV